MSFNPANELFFFFELLEKLNYLAINYILSYCMNEELLLNSLEVEWVMNLKLKAVVAGIILPIILHQMVKKVRCLRTALLGMKA